MSVIRCAVCECTLDMDFVDTESIGEVIICIDCFTELTENGGLAEALGVDEDEIETDELEEIIKESKSLSRDKARKIPNDHPFAKRPKDGYWWERDKVDDMLGSLNSKKLKEIDEDIVDEFFNDLDVVGKLLN
jgi:PAS domain-containing protein